MAGDLDPDTLVELCVLDEIVLQCQWGLDHLETLKLHAAGLEMKGASRTEFNRWEAERSAVFREVQSILTCASIADSLLTGRGSPRPKGLVGVTKAQRVSIQKKLNLPSDFEIPGRPQRNALIHIEERVVPWSKGPLRASMLASPRELPDHPSYKELLRGFGRKPLVFAVLGERCNLEDLGAALTLLGKNAVRVQRETLAEVNAARSTSG